ncbi:hypothetical protein [Tautonia marina]|uniref:hypothetical protein n=1 Tax=Tautonia marina TaxID=2653855 RepID=UPI001260A70C|nr:hypothetical protein [Tautonia marina]
MIRTCEWGGDRGWAPADDAGAAGSTGSPESEGEGWSRAKLGEASDWVDQFIHSKQKKANAREAELSDIGLFFLDHEQIT